MAAEKSECVFRKVAVEYLEMASREYFLSLLKTNSFEKPFINYFSTEKTGLSISRREFHTVTERVEALLLKSIGDDFEFIGIELNDYLWLPCLLTSLWKLGKACACIGTQYSQECNINFLNTLNVTYLIAEDKKSNFAADLVEKLHINDRTFTVWKMKSNSMGDVSNKPLDICYGIMTSGSTASPKIIQVPWTCIMPNVYELINLFSVTENDNIYLSSPYTFDPFFVELFISLFACCTLTIVSSRLKMSSDALLNTLFGNEIKTFCKSNWDNIATGLVCKTNEIIQSPITILQMTPSTFKRWSLTKIEEIVLSEESSLRILILGGEKFPSDLLKLKSGKNKTQIYNIYGITEISCWAFISNVTHNQDDISLGRPLNDVVYKVDENNELFVGSSKRRCFIDKEKNAETDEVVYRKTGDLVKIRNSQIYYIGRTNQIVKKFGIKLNLEKIENEFLRVCKDVEECICIFYEKTMSIALFYSNAQLNKDYLVRNERYIGLDLRSIEIPDLIVEVPRIPLNSNGKRDKKSLLMLFEKIMVKQKGKDVEEIFHSIWMGVVGKGNFVNAGGDSVKALQLIGRLEEAGVEISKNFLPTLLTDGGYQNCLTCVRKTGNKKIRLETEEKIYNLSIFWTFDTRKCVDASPSVFIKNGEVHAVVGSHSSRLSSVKVDTGQENWTINLSDRIESGFSVDKSSTFGVIGCYDHHIYCISTLDGKILWNYKTEGIIKSTPCLSSDEESVFVASYDTFLYRLKCRDGTLIKRLKLSNRGVFSSGVISDEIGAFFIGTLDGSCISVNQLTNEFSWKNRLSSPVFASPVLVTSNKIGISVIFAEVTGRINCFDAKTGNKSWIYECSGCVYSTPVFLFDYLVFPCYDNYVYCLRFSEKPSIKWRIQMDSSGFAKPCPLSIADTWLISIASTKGSIYLIHLETGTNLGHVKLEGEIFSSPKFSHDKLILGCRDNNLYCMKIEKILND